MIHYDVYNEGTNCLQSKSIKILLNNNCTNMKTTRIG